MWCAYPCNELAQECAHSAPRIPLRPDTMEWTRSSPTHPSSSLATVEVDGKAIVEKGVLKVAR